MSDISTQDPSKSKSKPRKGTLPFAGFEWNLSMRYLRARRKEGFISVIAGFSFAGIMLGVATLIIVMSVMNGFRVELMGKILGLNGHMMVRGMGENLANYDAFVDELSIIDGVVRVAPMVEGQAMASSQFNGSGVLVRGMREKDMLAIPEIANNLQAGTLRGFDSSGGVAIGKRLAQSLYLKLGDTVTLLSPRGAVTPFGMAPRVRSYPITAIFEVGMTEYDSSFVFLPLSVAQKFFKTGDRVTALEIMIEDPDEVEQFLTPVGDVTGPMTRVYTWQHLNASFFNALQVERNVMFLILTLILIVASLNIVSGLIMMVKDKGKDIAVMRTMGVTRGAVMRIFFIAGASIGTAGTLAGLILGTVFCANIETLRQAVSSLTNSKIFDPEVYFLAHLPAQMEVSEVTSVVLMALALSFAATLYPAWRAASLDPVEALRYE